MANVPAWEDPGATFPLNWIATWCRSVFDPGAFFANGPRDASAARPVLYYLIISILGAGLWLTWGPVLSSDPPSLAGPLYDLIGRAGARVPPELPRPAGMLVDFFFAPFVAVIYLALWSVLLHLFVRLLSRGPRPLSATVRTVCYASGPGVFGVVPLVGLVAGIWSVVMTVIGLRESHEMTTGRALAAWFLAVLIPAVVLVCLLILVIVRVASRA